MVIACTVTQHPLKVVASNDKHTQNMTKTRYSTLKNCYIRSISCSVHWRDYHAETKAQDLSSDDITREQNDAGRICRLSSQYGTAIPKCKRTESKTTSSYRCWCEFSVVQQSTQCTSSLERVMFYAINKNRTSNMLNVYRLLKHTYFVDWHYK